MELYTLLILCWCCTKATQGAEGFYNIAHMTNNKDSVLWAVEKGANSVEIDLKFDENGVPLKFYHGSPCDCSCMCPAGGCYILYPNSVCVQLEKTSKYPCDASSKPKELLNLLAQQESMAMVLIDSKIGSLNKAMQQKAAKKVVALVEKELFEKGFQGEVIFGAGKFSSLPYITAISKANSKHKNKIHFTIDQEDMAQTKSKLDVLENKNIVYNVGESACSPRNVANKKLSHLAALNKVKGVWGMTYTWSVDRHSTLDWYTNYFTGIITNYPGTLANIVKNKKIKLATPSDIIPPATSSETVTSNSNYESCDCDYFSGGCKIVKKAPKGMACQCDYHFLWSCQGWVVLCSDSNRDSCKSPDNSKQSCLEGRGGCGGY
ncbi:dermonecrotic toxin StSicTox-betaIB1i-like [Hydractinia symbiolongicarpus]|uniref:dermonecrotic toxin StSicTox-betaIB1i-like n=1 Tax=Hydractinia symbiolongicarpus TaxID=13093 RepID=UPI00254FA2D4|nr:dermonecrotic toxin StSicTox-betaIB1i-like [Hydractinia symbiolongicarpus]